MNRAPWMINVSLALAILALPTVAGCTKKTLHANDTTLQGVWRIVKSEKDGKDDDLLVGRYFVFAGESLVFYRLKDGILFETSSSTLKIDDTTIPKRIDILFTQNGSEDGRKGIYELNDETLKILFNVNNREYPKEFKTILGDGRFVVQLRRVGSYEEEIARRKENATQSDGHSSQSLPLND